MAAKLMVRGPLAKIGRRILRVAVVGCTAVIGSGGCVSIGGPESAVGEVYRLREAAGTGAGRLVELCGAEDPEVRRVAADALGTFGREEGVAGAEIASALEALLADPDETVRYAAAFALGRVGAAGPLRELLHSADPNLRLLAVRGLGRAGNAEDLAALGARLAEDPVPPVRGEAAIALAQVAPERAGEVLAAALATEEDAAVRWRIRRALEGESEASGAAVGEPAESPLPEVLPRQPVPGDGIPVEFLRTEPVVRFTTRHGSFDVALAPALAPLHAWNMLQVAARGGYVGRTFEAVVPGRWVAGCGGEGRERGLVTRNGGVLRPEVNPMPFLRGTVGAFRLAGREVSGDEFFVTLAPAPELDGQETAFGRVVRGVAVVERIETGDVVEEIAILGAATEAPIPSDDR